MKRTAVPLLASPVFTGAVALLVLNDHFLKANWPSVITGKLSDVAGVVMVSVLLRCLLRHDLAAVSLAAVAFTCLKTLPEAAVLAAPVLGGMTATDTSDTLAVIVLLPVYVWFGHRDGHPVARVPAIGLLQLPALFIGVGATTATSCAEPVLLDRFVVDGSTVWAGVSEERYDSDRGYYTDVRWAKSGDSGQTWEESDEPPNTASRPSECEGDDGVCWRTRPETRVERDDGSGWVTAFEFTDEQEKRQYRATESMCGDSKDGTFGAVAVLDGDTSVVLVAMGTQGVLRFDGTEWQRIGVLGRHPAPMPAPSFLVWLPYFGALGLTLLSLAFFAVGRREPWLYRPNARWRLAAGTALGFAGTVIVVYGLMIATFDSRRYHWWAIGMLAIAIALFVASIVTVVRPLRPLTPHPLAPPGPDDEPVRWR